MAPARARYLILLTVLTAIELVTPSAIYLSLFVHAHGAGVEVYSDPACWAPTVQFVIWIICCIALVGVAGSGYEWFRPRGGWLVKAGVCRQCNRWLTFDDLYCPACAASTTEWRMPASMLSQHARECAARAAAANTSIPPAVTEAARFLVAHANPVNPEAAAALEVFCLGNATLQRRLYFAAALRLHPDRNDGELRGDWQRLQLAVRTLREHLATLGAAPATNT